ncbi:ornithine carbamoyltransferase [Lancefieldella rimae]|uniref:ornithine carbamoyltransferase n=1 Tax=Lancefieldella rimae TaxID=1383 RepID=UPI0008A1B256|nr:ornithine carbamoyltransferase [Lancefieldella rimae]MBF4804137.1 ornithine carbamoyltransferase [Lancefieldella rimae]OFR22804.1 ornithine carbamoyltransferase [Atopobium sp. HMSC064B08]
MGVNVRGRSFLTLLDYTPDEIRYLLDLSVEFKNMKRNGVDHSWLKGRQVVLLFEKTSTRTRCAFEVGARDLGMGVTFLDSGSSQMGKKESLEDTAKVLGRMFDGIEYRGFDQGVVEDLAKYSGVPVWNGLTDDFHPTQMLADIMTVQEEFGDVRGRKLTFFGDARNNVANSLMVVCAKLGMHFCACGPKELMPKQELIDKCEAIAKETHAVLEFTDDVKVGAKDADVLYTDIWLSMGEPEELWAQRIELLRPYQVNKEVMAAAKPTAIFLHCLPSFHDRHTTIGENIYQKYGLEAMEVTDDVFLGHQAREFEEAENRMHTIKAVMYATLK